MRYSLFNMFLQSVLYLNLLVLGYLRVFLYSTLLSFIKLSVLYRSCLSKVEMALFCLDLAAKSTKSPYSKVLLDMRWETNFLTSKVLYSRWFELGVDSLVCFLVLLSYLFIGILFSPSLFSI